MAELLKGTSEILQDKFATAFSHVTHVYNGTNKDIEAKVVGHNTSATGFTTVGPCTAVKFWTSHKDPIVHVTVKRADDGKMVCDNHSIKTNNSVIVSKEWYLRHTVMGEITKDVTGVDHECTVVE